MKTINFRHWYPKLRTRLIPTLRKRKQAETGDRCLLRINGADYVYATCLWVFKTTLAEVPTPFLCYDTNTKTREDALRVLSSFYSMGYREEEPAYVHLLFVTKQLQRLVKRDGN